MYDPAIGRWHVKDAHSETYYSWSSYNYCLNNPINLIDLFGLDPVYRNGKYYDTNVVKPTRNPGDITVVEGTPSGYNINV